jgi:hypothetical protein
MPMSKVVNLAESGQRDYLPPKKLPSLRAVEVVLTPQGINVASNEFGRALGGGLYELRIRQTATEIRRRVAGLPPDEVDYPPEAVFVASVFLHRWPQDYLAGGHRR